MAGRPRAYIAPAKKPVKPAPTRGRAFIKPGKKGPQVSTVPGPRTKSNPTGQYKVQPKKNTAKVVAKGPSSTVTRPSAPAVTRTAPPRNPVVTRPKTTGTVTGPKATGKGGGKGGGGPKTTTTTTKTTTTKGMSVGFDPKKMAQTLTNLGYDADLAAISAEIAQTKGDMGEALKDIQAWSEQLEVERARGQEATQAAFAAAAQQGAASDAAVSQLFGGSAAGENAAYANVGEDMLAALGASDQSFSQNMQAILKSQQMDYERRLRSAFGQDIDELEQALRTGKKEKSQAYQENLMQLMDMAWSRQQDIREYETAQQAMASANAMAGIDLMKGQQDIVQGNQQIAANKLDLKAKQVALRKSQTELRKLATQQGGLDWSNPNTAAQIGNAAFTGALSERGTFLINPKVAWENAQILLGQYQAAGDSRAMAAIWRSFKAILNLSHAHKRWGQYRIVNNQLVYDPTKKFKKR